MMPEGRGCQGHQKTLPETGDNHRSAPDSQKATQVSVFIPPTFSHKDGGGERKQTAARFTSGLGSVSLAAQLRVVSGTCLVSLPFLHLYKGGRK